MVKIHVAPLVKYTVTIRVDGLRKTFDTLAVSEAEAVNNGISQYARQLNWSISKLRGYLKAAQSKPTAVLAVPK